MKFRKKPVVIDAVQFKFNDTSIAELEAFCGDALGNIRKEHDMSPAEAEIGTLEDGVHLTVKHIATEGDWIIRGVQGEFYACKPDIFEATYERAE
jgi:hypothetical protein